MGLFKKNKKEKNINEKEKNTNVEATPEVINTTQQPVQNENQTTPVTPVQPQPQVQSNPNSSEQPKENEKSNVEVLEFDENDIKKQIARSNRKENRLLFGIIAFLIVFTLLLPTITSLISKNSVFTYNRVVEDIESDKTVDGMLEIGSDEGSITAKNIQFYNATKKLRNEIHLVYLPETGIKNVADLDIYIELYNSNKQVIYRTPFDVASVERKVQGTYVLELNEKIYTEATYVKITIIKDEEFTTGTDTLVCTNNTTDENYKLTQKITYNFSSNGLISYQVNKEVTIIENANDEDDYLNDGTTDEETITNTDKYAKLFKEEANEINRTNISDLEYDEESIKYSVDVKTFIQGSSDYIKLYDLGSVKRQIKLTEESKSWSCN